MKYAVIIPDGAADAPLDELDGRTPLEAARTPNLDRLARSGRVGTVTTTPEGWGAGSDVCSMCLLGYDPETDHTGRAPLEAAAMGLDLKPEDWVFRVNLVTVSEDGRMLDHSAGGISSEEAKALFDALQSAWHDRAPDIAQHLALRHGVEYRGALIDRAGAAGGGSHDGLVTTPPHEIPGEPWHNHLPTGSEQSEAMLGTLMEIAADVLPRHEINRKRQEDGKRPANACWIWGQGTATKLEPFEERFRGLKGAITTAVDLLTGIGLLMGWDLLRVPGATGFHDNDYAGQGRACVEALDSYDIVCCHVESPDESAHQGDAQTKVAAIEAIDEHVVGPILRRLEQFGDPEKDPVAIGWRVLVLPDHYTLVGTRKHDPTPVPFAMAGAWVRSVVERCLTESDAAESDLHIDPGHELMEYFLFSGRAGAKSK